MNRITREDPLEFIQGQLDGNYSTLEIETTLYDIYVDERSEDYNKS